MNTRIAVPMASAVSFWANGRGRHRGFLLRGSGRVSRRWLDVGGELRGEGGEGGVGVGAVGREGDLGRRADRQPEQGDEALGVGLAAVLADRRSGSRTGSPPGRTGPPAGHGARTGSMTTRSDLGHRQARGSLAIVAAPSAAATTSSIDAPMLAWTAARIAPSTSGASLIRTRARSAVVEVLERELEAERGAAEVEQDERPRRRPRRASTGGPRRSAARWCPGVRPRSHRRSPRGPRRRRPGRPCRAGRRRACRCGRPGPGPPIAPPFIAGCCPGLLVGGDAPPELVKKKARRHQEVR